MPLGLCTEAIGGYDAAAQLVMHPNEVGNDSPQHSA